MNEVVIFPSKFKMVLLTVGALIFVCVGLAFAIWRNEAGLTFWEFAFMAWVVIPFFGFSFLYFGYRLIVPKPAVIVSQQGIFYNSSPLSAGLVKWEELAEIYVHNINIQRYLVIVPLDIEAFLQRQPIFKRWLMKINVHTGFAPINIPQFTLRMKADELMLRIQEYRQNHAG